jgi:putative ABC transport system permease protein
MGVSLFVSTNINGRRAEKSLLDFSRGYFVGDYSFKISGSLNNPIKKEFIKELYYSQKWVEKIYPRIQKNVYMKGNKETLTAVYLGIDFLNEGRNYKLPRSDDSVLDFSEILLFSPTLDEYYKKNYKLEYKNQNFDFKDYKIINELGGIFLIEDIDKSKDRFQIDGYDYLLLIGIPSELELKELINFISTTSTYTLESSKEISERAGSALKSYNLNLMIVSMISILISFFMVSNTMAGIYISRKRELGILRCIGSSPDLNLKLFLSQGVFLGVIGTFFGISLGKEFADLRFFTGESTITDFYQASSYKDFPFDIFLISCVIGIGGTTIASILPSIRSRNTSPLSIIKDQEVSHPIYFNTKLLGMIGFAMLIVSYPIARIELNTLLPIFGFLAIGIVVVGQTLMFPFFIDKMISLFRNFFQKFDNSFVEFRIGAEEVYQNLIKNVLTSAALMLAISLVITLVYLTDSYKKSIVDWTIKEFPYQFSIVNIKDIEEGTRDALPLELKATILGIEEVEEIDIFIFQNKIEARGKNYMIHSFDMDLMSKKEKKLGIDSIPDNYKNGVLISSNMAYLEKIKIGDKIELPTIKGKIEFTILGIREHFFSETGTIMMDIDPYTDFFQPDRYNSIRVNFKEGMESVGLEKLENLLKNNQDFKVLSQKELSNLYIIGTEKVFKVLDSLKVTAFFIALISLYSSILYGVSEKIKIYGVFRSLGASNFQLSKMVFMENFIITFLGSLMGILSTFLLGPIVIDVINKNSFGWTLKTIYPVELALLFLVISPIIAITGGIYPAIIFHKMSLKQVLSYE